jgi:hypothetical protein
MRDSHGRRQANLRRDGFQHAILRHPSYRSRWIRVPCFVRCTFNARTRLIIQGDGSCPRNAKRATVHTRLIAAGFWALHPQWLQWRSSVQERSAGSLTLLQ